MKAPACARCSARPPSRIHFLSLKPGKGDSGRGVSGSLSPGSLLRRFLGDSYARCRSAPGLLSFCTHLLPTSPPLPFAKPQSCSLQPPGNPLTRSWDLGPGWPVWFQTSASSLRLGVNVNVRGSTKHSSDPGAPRDGSSFPDPGGWKLCHASLCVSTSCALKLTPRQAGPGAGGPHAQTRVAVGAVGVLSAIPPRVTSKAREGSGTPRLSLRKEKWK